MLDGELLWRYPLLSNKEKFDFAKQIGTTQNQVSDHTHACLSNCFNKKPQCSHILIFQCGWVVGQLIHTKHYLVWLEGFSELDFKLQKF